MNKPQSEKQRVVVAMSGGVDSSVTAALLADQGYQVIGMMMRLWSEPGCEQHNRCCTPDAMAQARRVSAILGIPFYAVDAQQVFRETVVEAFLQGYTQGVTPNPCLVCNRQIRWEFLLERALAMGADYMATGHYCRLRKDEQGNQQLLRGIDELKDQSYVLHVLGQEQFQKALFPLGKFTKPQVRQMARDFKLPVAERADSQDLCFLGDGDYREFLARYSPQTRQPGPILNRSGEELGRHNGLAFYTIGQRKGIGVAAPRPLYVLGKDASRNALIVGHVEELGGKQFETQRFNWISAQPPVEPFRAAVKIRYKASDAPCIVTPLEDGRVKIDLDEPLRDITPGQAAVVYDGKICLGGGTIQQ
jgi:tRNA-specific 2-thiouridylase